MRCTVRCVLVSPCGQRLNGIIVCVESLKPNLGSWQLLLHTYSASKTNSNTLPHTHRYRKPADWSLIGGAANNNPALPVIGNGDVLTWYEGQRRMTQPGMHAVMVGRGALIRPWIFQEFKDVGGLPLACTAASSWPIWHLPTCSCMQYVPGQFGNRVAVRRPSTHSTVCHCCVLLLILLCAAMLYAVLCRAVRWC